MYEKVFPSTGNKAEMNVCSFSVGSPSPAALAVGLSVMAAVSCYAFPPQLPSLILVFAKMQADNGSLSGFVYLWLAPEFKCFVCHSLNPE